MIGNIENTEAAKAAEAAAIKQDNFQVYNSLVASFTKREAVTDEDRVATNRIKERSKKNRAAAAALRASK
jgi:hypothetical protein